MKLLNLNTAIPLIFCYCTYTHAFQDCPYLGPVFPEPTQLSTSLVIKNASSALQAAIQDGIRTGTIESNFTSYSLEIFSKYQSDSLFEFHHTAPVPANSTNTKTVDSKSIYRIASISKLLTVYLFLIQAGDVNFHEPISKYVPELAGWASKAAQDPVGVVDWDHITIGNLASHLGGIGRDWSFGDVGPALSTIDVTKYGLPIVSPSEIPSCGTNCTREEFFAGFTTRHPVFAPATTPTYSNIAFQILGYALESITGRSFQTMFNDVFIDKLKLDGTSFSKPINETHGVIPDGAVIWDQDLGDFGPAGGVYSSTSDMVKIGQSILNSSLLDPALTRRWMKPVTHTSNPLQAIGAPWEIMSIRLPTTNRLVDVYAKSGSLSPYTSLVALMPDWGIGFVVMVAGQATWDVLVELIAEIFLQAVEDAAREEADQIYSGTYVSTDPNLNSSLTITTDPLRPGLGISNFISNGTDLLQSYVDLLGANIPITDLSLRLYPTNLITQETNGDKKVAWRALIEYTGGPAPPPRVFDIGCSSWGGADGLMYGSIAFDDFVFTIGEGSAKSIEPRFFRVVLNKA